MIKKFSVALFVSVLFFGLANFAFAADGSTAGTINLGDLNPLGSACADMKCVLGNLLTLASSIAMIITPFIVMYGAFQILTANGDPKKVQTGGKTILYAIIGFIIAFISKDVAELLLDVVKGGSS